MGPLPLQLSRGSGDNGRTINRGRALRALGLGCVVGAVPKMHRPAADRGRKNDRRDAEWLARMLARRNVVEVWVPDERPRGRARRPATRQAADVEVPAAPRPRLRRDDAGRQAQGRLDGAYWDWTESLSFDEPDDAAAYEHYMDGNDLVENPRTVYVAGDVDELVEHEQPRGRHVVQQFRQRSLALRVAELENQLRGLPEPDRHVRGDRAHREGDCHARLAAPGLTEEDEVFARLFVSTAN